MSGERQTSGQPSQLRALTCPGCGAPLPLRARGLSVTVFCSACGAAIDVTQAYPSVISALATPSNRIKPTLDIGTRGHLEGIEWEIIGYLRKEATTRDIGNIEASDQTTEWAEYLLFNPYRGLRWLVESDGHWNLVRTTKSRPTAHSRNGAIFQGTHFGAVEHARARVIQVLGEFTWRVKVGDTVESTDYRAGDTLLSLERDESEEVWSIARYVYPLEIQKGFGIGRSLPQPGGIDLIEPDPCLEAFGALKGPYLCAIVILVLIQMKSVLTDTGKLALEQVIPPSGVARVTVSEPFHLDDRNANLEVELLAYPLQGTREVQMTLVNNRSGETTSFERELFFWSGSDVEDGPWVEDGRRQVVLLPTIPGGDYHLTCQTVGGLRGTHLTVNVRRSVLNWGNFWLAVAGVTLYPLFIAIAMASGR